MSRLNLYLLIREGIGKMPSLLSPYLTWNSSDGFRAWVSPKGETLHISEVTNRIIFTQGSHHSALLSPLTAGAKCVEGL